MPDAIVATFGQHDAPGRRPGIGWRAELHEPDSELPFPLAVAWLSDYRTAGLGVVVDFILVPDHLRRRGYATRLIRECRDRWPDLALTDAISAEGKGLLRSLED
jgi:GNAT superfamily N-acetyltransferase